MADLSSYIYIAANTVSAAGNISGDNLVGNTIIANTELSGDGGNLSNLQVANVSGIGNIATINLDGNVSNILYGNGVFSSAPVTYGNSNVATFLASYGSNTISTTGNITAGNANLGNAVTANYFIGNFYGTANSATTAATVTTNAQPNITSTGTLTSLTVTGNITGGNIVSGGVANITGNVTGANLIAGSSGAGNVYAGNVIVNGQPTTYGYVNTTVVANTSPVETSINGGSSTSPALTVLTVAIPSAGTWRLDAELRVYVPGQGYMSAAFYDNGTLISGSEYFIAAGGVTQTGAATGQYGGFMSYNLTTTGARTVTLGIWSTTSSNCITSDDGRTWLRATLLNPSIAVQATATGTLNTDYISVTNTTGSSANYGATGASRDVILDTNLTSQGVTYNTSTGVYTLIAGKTYRITSTIGWYNTTPGYINFNWVDSSTNTAINSITITQANNNWATGQIDPLTADFIYTPVTNQSIKMRVYGSSNDTFQVMGGGASKVVIQQIANTFALNALATMSVTGNVSANNFTGNGGTLSNVATKVEGSWTLASGTNTVSVNVPLNGTYSIWVNGNIPNGIVTYTATAVVTNTNVPVLGSQYAWYYLVGNALVFTSIPNQFTGTVGSISTVNTYAGNTANVFTFGITNNSGNTAVVNYGYTKL